MEMIEKTGKTVEEALEAALAELGVDRDQVEYKVLEAPSKALFGLLGGREAKVEVVLKKVNPVDTARAFLENLPIPEAEKALIAHKNAEKLFRL